MADLARYQDPQTGLWYEVIDKSATPGNWTETSSSSMLTYVMDVAVKRGYISPKYHAAAEMSYRGVLTRISWPRWPDQPHRNLRGHQRGRSPVLPKPQAQYERSSRSRRFPDYE